MKNLNIFPHNFSSKKQILVYVPVLIMKNGPQNFKKNNHVAQSLPDGRPRKNKKGIRPGDSKEKNKII